MENTKNTNPKGKGIVTTIEHGNGILEILDKKNGYFQITTYSIKSGTLKTTAIIEFDSVDELQFFIGCLEYTVSDHLNK